MRVVHAAGPIPAVLHHADGAALELDDRDRLVFALRATRVHLGRHLRVHALHLRLAEEPPAERDAVAAEVHDGAAARLFDVPEPVGVRAGVLLALLHEMNASERALVRHLLRLDVFRREEQLLGVEQEHAGLRARVDHRVGFLESHAERLLADDVLAGRGGVDGDAARGGDSGAVIETISTCGSRSISR